MFIYEPAPPQESKKTYFACYIWVFCAELKVEDSQTGSQVYISYTLGARQTWDHTGISLVFWFSGLEIHCRRLLTWAPDRLDIKCIIQRDLSWWGDCSGALSQTERGRKEGKDYQDIDRSDQSGSGCLPARIWSELILNCYQNPGILIINSVSFTGILY